jgi:polyisoprenoid-binding protein YceI
MTLRSLTAVLLLAAMAAACGPTAEPTEPAAVEPSPTAAQPSQPTPDESAGSGQAADGPAVYTFLAGETVARFVIEEILSGNPKTVVGSTDKVSGAIELDLANPQQASVGAIEVDLTGLETDNGFRNRAIQDAILLTGQEGNRVATFVPTSIEGLPEQIEVGTAYPLMVTGDLTVKGATRQVTFSASVTPVSADRLEGQASLTIPYAELGVNIPRLPPQVASVEDEVTLEIQFAAAR